jgi:hypothetical protein
LDAAIAIIAQVNVEAEALYDVPGTQQIANQCWAMLGVVREMHYEMRQRMLRADGEIDAQQQSTPALTPSPSTYAPVSQPPAPPAPNPAGTLDNLYNPPSPKTWGETPYAQPFSLVGWPKPASAAQSQEQLIIRIRIVADHGNKFRFFKLWLFVNPVGCHLCTNIHTEVEFITIQSEKLNSLEPSSLC